MYGSSDVQTSDQAPLGKDIGYSQCEISGGLLEDCPVCVALRDSHAESVMTIADRTGPNGAGGEAVVDSVGFCGHHRGLLTVVAAKSQPLASTLASATNYLARLLREEARNAERLFEMFFSADRSCAICKIHDQHLAHHVHQIANSAESSRTCPTLCHPHYREVAYSLKASALGALAQAQLRRLELVVASIGAVEDKWEPAAAPPEVGSEATIEMLRVVAGEDEPGFDRLPSRGEGRGDDEASGIDQPTAEDRCPVCTEIERAEERWLGMVRSASRLGEDLWTVFPTCPVHIRQCARLGDTRIAVLAVRYAAHVELQELRDGVAALTRDNSNREIAKKSVFYKRQGPAYILGQQRKMVTRIGRCPACERLLVAQERGVSMVLQALRQSRRRNTGGDIERLCIKHFAAAYLHTLDGEARAWLIATAIERLDRLHVLLMQSGVTADSLLLRKVLWRAGHIWGVAI